MMSNYKLSMVVDVILQKNQLIVQDVIPQIFVLKVSSMNTLLTIIIISANVETAAINGMLNSKI